MGGDHSVIWEDVAVSILDIVALPRAGCHCWLVQQCGTINVGLRRGQMYRSALYIVPIREKENGYAENRR
jgi:hypothetical protein